MDQAHDNEWIRRTAMFEYLYRTFPRPFQARNVHETSSPDASYPPDLDREMASSFEQVVPIVNFIQGTDI